MFSPISWSHHRIFTVAVKVIFRAALSQSSFSKRGEALSNQQRVIFCRNHSVAIVFYSFFSILEFTLKVWNDFWKSQRTLQSFQRCWRRRNSLFRIYLKRSHQFAWLNLQPMFSADDDLWWCISFLMQFLCFDWLAVSSAVSICLKGIFEICMFWEKIFLWQDNQFKTLSHLFTSGDWKSVSVWIFVD